MKRTNWRLIKTPPSNGIWNMAFDEAMISSIGQGKQKPTLRLYAWSPPCISLGYAQPSSDVDFERIKRFGWDLVRRPSGGRAILHTDEITYSVVAPLGESRLAGGIIESYRRLSLALLEALSIIGVEAEADQEYEIPEHIDKKGPICFEVPSNYEITYQNKKLAGSAQVRRKEGILQHGTLPLNGDLTRIIDGLNFRDDSAREIAKEKLLKRAVNLEMILDRQISWDKAADAMVNAFESVLSLELSPEEPSPEEIDQTEKLVEDKYQNESWTFRI